MKERIEQTIERQIRDRDAKWLDPSERASFVHELVFWALSLDEDNATISGYVLWDLMCYAVHLMNQVAISQMDESLMNLAKAMNSWLYSAHYSFDETAIQLGPRRDEHIKFWENQLYEPSEEEEKD